MLEPCGAAELDAGILVGGAVLLYEGYRYFSKGGKQNIRPTWAEPYGLPLPGESASEYAKRLCDAHFGPGNYNTGPGSDYSKLKKWAQDKFGI